MAKPKINTEAAKLEETIRYHRRKYYAEFKPEISDMAYDLLVERLRKINPKALVLKEVGYPPLRKKIKLPFILGSLDNVSITNVAKWMKEQNDFIVASYKLDGVSVFVEYEKGILKTLATRGNGEYGEDITYKAPYIKNLPQQIKEKGTVSLRGEAIIEGKIPKGYKTRRSAAIGIIGRDDTRYANKISIKFYELLRHPKMPKTEKRRLALISKMGLDVVHNFILEKEITKETVDSLVDLLETKHLLNYDIDGIVLSKNLKERENVKIPKKAVAFKIDNLPIDTTVIDVKWQVTRTGTVVPVVYIDAIEIDGVEIQHPTGHNYDWLRRQGIGKGAIISVIRSGDVIPKIVAVKKKSKIPPQPKRCPSCNSFLAVSGVNLICTKSKCRDKNLAQVEYFIRTLGAENISIPTLDALNITSVRRFYNITKKEILETEGFQDAKTSLFIQERQKTLKTTKAKLIAAFGIPLVGYKVATKIIDESGIEKFHFFFTMNSNLLFLAIINIPGIGPAIAESFCESIPHYLNIYKFLRKKGLRFIKTEKTNILQGKSFQFSGSMSLQRKEMEELVLTNGGRISSVSKKLDYLVIPDKSWISTKVKKAKELNIKIITEKQFMKKLKRS